MCKYPLLSLCRRLSWIIPGRRIQQECRVWVTYRFPLRNLLNLSYVDTLGENLRGSRSSECVSQMCCCAHRNWGPLSCLTRTLRLIPVVFASCGLTTAACRLSLFLLFAWALWDWSHVSVLVLTIVLTTWRLSAFPLHGFVSSRVQPEMFSLSPCRTEYVAQDWHHCINYRNQNICAVCYRVQPVGWDRLCLWMWLRGICFKVGNTLYRHFYSYRLKDMRQFRILRSAVFPHS